MAHSTVGRHPPIQRQKTNLKKNWRLKLSKSGLRRCKKFGHTHSDENDERKIALSLNFAFYVGFPDSV